SNDESRGRSQYSANSAAAPASFCRIPAYQLVKVAGITGSSLVLNDERQIAFVELFKPVIPGDLFQGACSAIAREIQPNHASVIAVAGSSDAGGCGSALFRPASNFLVIGQRSCRC